MEENTSKFDNVLPSNEDNTAKIELTPTVWQDLVTSVKWGKIFAIMGIICAVIMFIAAVSMLFIGQKTQEYDGIMHAASGFTEISAAITYFIVAIIYAIISVILLKSVKNIDNGLKTSSQSNFASGIHHLKTFNQILGILTIVSIGIIVLMLLLSAVIGMAIL